MAYAINVARNQASGLAGFDHDEVPGIALLALTEAARRWTPDKGCTLRTFAHYRIVGAVLDAHRARNGRYRTHRHTEVPIEEWHARNDLAADAMNASAQLRLILPAIASMSPADQELLAAEAVGETLEDVGGNFGITRSWACRRRQSARAKLGETVGQNRAVESAG